MGLKDSGMGLGVGRSVVSFLASRASLALRHGGSFCLGFVSSPRTVLFPPPLLQGVWLAFWNVDPVLLQE